MPFDSTSSQITALLSGSDNNTFPPPLACYPNLTAKQTAFIKAQESNAFDLPDIPRVQHFDTSCYPDRPIYGVLNVFRLRLPFIDSMPNAAKQGAVLGHDVASRVVVYNGEYLSALPSSNGSGVPLESNQYGTLNNLKHIIYDYLTSMPDTNIAMAFAKFVLTSPTVPPVNTSSLYQTLSSLPMLEVAVFGTVDSSDISSVVSSFSTPSGSLFFGSDDGSTFRNWAIGSDKSTITWAESATSPIVVQDSSFMDATFNQTWLAAATTEGATVADVVRSFTLTNKFTP